MNNYVAYAVIVVILTGLLQGSVYPLHQLLVQGFILISAVYLMFKRKMPKSFSGNLIVLVFLPPFFICLALSILSGLPALSGVKVHSTGIILLLLLMLYALMGWRRLQNRRNQSQTHKSNERTFILPGHSTEKKKGDFV